MLADESVDTIITSPPYWLMRTFKYGGGKHIHMDNPPHDKTNGRFMKGRRYSIATEFKKGEHWRSPKPYWNKDWLVNEYIINGKSCEQIASENGCGGKNISYFMRKFNIKARTMKEIRANKYWGVTGERNGMYGRVEEDNPNWKGGHTPERQAFYASREWSDVVRDVWHRDDATCVRCKTHQSDAGEMHIHHIVSFSVKEMRSEIGNLVLLCKKCHSYVHSKQNKNGEFLACPLQSN